MSNTKNLNLKDFEKSEIIEQVYAPSLMKGRGKEKLIGELDKAGKNVKTVNGWVPVKGNEHLVNDGNKKENKNAEIQDVRKLIKEQIGLDLKVADEERIKKLHGRKYFNAFLNERVSESKEFDLLKNFADKYKIIDIEPNGFKQIAIFFNDKENYTKTLTNADVNVHPDIKEAIDNYKGGTIASEVLIYLASKYANKQPIETFSSAHGAPIKVYGKEGNNYAINFGGARGIILATPKDMDALRGTKKEVVQETVHKPQLFRHYEKVELHGGDSASKAELGYTGYGFIEDTTVNSYGLHKVRLEKKPGFPNLKDDVGYYSPDQLKKVTTEKPAVQLSGTDGNVFSIIGKVSGALKKAGQADRAKEFTDKALKAGSYDEVLRMVHEYVNAK